MWFDDKLDGALGTGTGWLDRGVITHVFPQLYLLRLARDELPHEQLVLRTDHDNIKSNEWPKQAEDKTKAVRRDLMIF